MLRHITIIAASFLIMTEQGGTIETQEREPVVIKASAERDLEALRRDAEQGDAGAQYLLGGVYQEGRGVPQDYAQAAYWARRAAEQGFAPAQFDLGLMYERGRGVPQDDVLAHMWFNLSASVSFGRFASARRDRLANYMTADQIEEARRLAREWMAERR